MMMMIIEITRTGRGYIAAREQYGSRSNTGSVTLEEENEGDGEGEEKKNPSSHIIARTMWCRRRYGDSIQ